MNILSGHKANQQSLFTDYNDEAEFLNTGKKRFLIVDSYRYHRNRIMGDVTHWRCVCYPLNKCRARASTKFINGCERVKVNYNYHTHDTQSFYFSG